MTSLFLCLASGTSSLLPVDITSAYPREDFVYTETLAPEGFLEEKAEESRARVVVARKGPNIDLAAPVYLSQDTGLTHYPINLDISSLRDSSESHTTHPLLSSPDTSLAIIKEARTEHKNLVFLQGGSDLRAHAISPVFGPPDQRRGKSLRWIERDLLNLHTMMGVFYTPDFTIAGSTHLILPHDQVKTRIDLLRAAFASIKVSLETKQELFEKVDDKESNIETEIVAYLASTLSAIYAYDRLRKHFSENPCNFLLASCAELAGMHLAYGSYNMINAVIAFHKRKELYQLQNVFRSRLEAASQRLQKLIALLQNIQMRGAIDFSEFYPEHLLSQLRRRFIRQIPFHQP